MASRMHKKPPLASLSGERKANTGSLRRSSYQDRRTAKLVELSAIQRIVANCVGIESRLLVMPNTPTRAKEAKAVFSYLCRQLGHSVGAISSFINASPMSAWRYSRHAINGEQIYLGGKWHCISDVADLLLEQARESGRLSTINATSKALQASKQVQCNQSDASH